MREAHVVEAAPENPAREEFLLQERFHLERIARLRVEGHERPAPGADGTRVGHLEVADERVVAVAEHASKTLEILRYAAVPELLDRRLCRRQRQRLAAERGE